MIPKFAIIVGAMKSGTTSLYNYLAQHPQVAACELKEPNFFASDEHWARGVQWYEDLWDFDPTRHEVALEATANYSKVPFFPSAASRMSELEREFKFIYVMRDPIERLESHLTHGVAVGWVPPGLPIEEYRAAISVSKYAMQLDEYFRHFPADDIMLVDFAALRDDPAALLERVQAFVGLEPFESFRLDRVHNRSAQRRREHPFWLALRNIDVLERVATTVVPRTLRRGVRRLISKPPARVRLDEAERAYVADQLRDDRRRLEEEYGFDTSGWEWS